MEKILLLEKLPFFQSFSESKLLLIAGIMKTRYSDKGAVMLEEGRPITEFFFVLKGSLSVYKSFQVQNKKIQVLIGKYRENDYFGEEAILLHKNQEEQINSSITAKCESAVHLGIFTIYDALTKFKSSITPTENVNIANNQKLVAKAYFKNFQQKQWEKEKKKILDQIKEIYKESDRKRKEKEEKKKKMWKN